MFNMDDPSSNVRFGDTSTQYHLKAFEKQLASWHSTVPSSVDIHMSTHISSSLNLYMHEIAIHHDHNVDDFRPGPEEMARSLYAPSGSKYHAQPHTAGHFVTVTHIDALAQCLDSSHRTLDAWLSMSIETARCAPNLGVVWNTYAIVALIKLHGLLHAPDSKLGEVFSPDLKVDYYLLAVIERLQEISADGRCPPAEAFVYVVRKLRSWFEHKRSGLPEPSDAGSGGGDTRGNDGGFVTSHRQHADDILRLAHDRHYLSTDSPRSGLASRKGAADMDSSSAPFPTATTAQASQGLVGTSSMPSSQLNPIGTMGFPGSQAQGNPFSNNGQFHGMSDLNMAYNAASYNIDWDELNFSQQELNVFDEFMGERGWMGYLM